MLTNVFLKITHFEQNCVLFSSDSCIPSQVAVFVRIDTCRNFVKGNTVSEQSSGFPETTVPTEEKEEP